MGYRPNNKWFIPDSIKEMKLTPEETRILDLRIQNYKLREIAEYLGVSYQTIANRLTTIRGKYHVMQMRWTGSMDSTRKKS